MGLRPADQAREQIYWNPLTPWNMRILLHILMYGANLKRKKMAMSIMNLSLSMSMTFNFYLTHLAIP